MFYEPVPFEFLYTNESNPQVIVSVDSIPAVCAGLSCDFTYETATSSISSLSLSGTTLTITGTSLPTTDLQRVVFSNNDCVVSSSSSTEIVCEVTTIAGTNWFAEVYDSYGKIPYDSSYTTGLDVSLTITSVSPNTDLNEYGGTLLTI